MTRLPFTEPDEIRRAIGAAAEVVAGDGVLLVPTESHYGLAADPRRVNAVDAVYALKGRPGSLALPVVCSDWDQVEELVEIPAAHRIRLSRTWPAALTVIAPCRGPVAASPTGTLAVRIPAHDGLRALLYRVGPLTATSANRHGGPPSPTVDGALASLEGRPDLVLDGGELAGGSVSTLVDLSGAEARVLRPGPVPWDEPFDPERWLLDRA